MRMSVDPRQLDWFETHGHWSAEQVLLPRDRLLEVASNVVVENRNLIDSLTAEPKVIFEYLSNVIATPFNVSLRVIQCRISRKDVEKETKKMIEDL